MRLRGGYVVKMAGKPGPLIETLPEPDELHLPLSSARFDFSELCVGDGERVHQGKALAKDPYNHGVPLLAPCGGTVSLDGARNHLTIRNVTSDPPEPFRDDAQPEHIARDFGSIGMKRYKLLMLGAWQFFHDARTGMLPEPFGVPQAVIVSTINLEPFNGRGDAQLTDCMKSFTRGVEQLQSLLEYQPIYLVLPKVATDLAERVRDAVRGYAYVKPVQVPLVYPFDNFAVLARGLGLARNREYPVWGLRTEGVLALDRALTDSRPCNRRVVSIGGPGVKTPAQVAAMPGYPLKDLLAGRLSDGPKRLIAGGALTGQVIAPDRLGLDCECTGITVLDEQAGREFLGFMRPGFKRRSYSRCFAGVVRRDFPSAAGTAVYGERRPCVSCGFCEDVCPAGIMPHLLHKLLFHGDAEAAEKARLDLCVGCGLCTFVCPSKIELREQFRAAGDAATKRTTPEASA